ncbi:MAG: tRNA (adenosine(37)-N6)-dimethylallyltransferase MiaA [Herpetosiphon sp.]
MAAIEHNQHQPTPVNPPLLALVGPTGVGKTSLAIKLAQHLGGEIIGADSRQIYRHMEIGTAKPTHGERTAAPHHLIDVVEPTDPWSLALYLDLAWSAIADVTRRGKLPILVGGTGQYLQAVLAGWHVPRVEPQWLLRTQLEQVAARDGVEALQSRLEQVDPVAAATLTSSNLRRIIRALEVYELTGRPISEQQLREPPPYTILTLWLDLPRSELYPRLDLRVDTMLQCGLLDEVTTLLDRGYSWALPAMSSLGYREWQPHFVAGDSVESCIQNLKYNTHNFVRKQTAWFKRLPHLQRVAANSDAEAHALTLIQAHLAP